MFEKTVKLTGLSGIQGILIIDHTHLGLSQLCDSQLPTGAFNHSFDLETYIQRNMIRDDHTFIAWLKTFLQEQLTHSDGLAMRLVYDVLESDGTRKVLRIDKLMFVQNLPKETHVGVRQMGTRMVRLVLKLYDDPWIARYYQQMQDKKAKLDPAICFTMLGHHLGVGIETIIDYYLYQNVSSLTRSVVRVIPLGQAASQKIVTHTIPYIEKTGKQVFELREVGFSMTTPGLELNQMAHGNINVRIFIL